MSLGVIPIVWLEFLRVLEKKRKRRNQENLALMGLFVAAKGTLAPAKCFAAAKGCLAAVRPKGQKRAPRVRQGVALLCRGKVLSVDEDTVHHDQISDFVSESLVFLHR